MQYDIKVLVIGSATSNDPVCPPVSWLVCWSVTVLRIIDRNMNNVPPETEVIETHILNSYRAEVSYLKV